MEHDFSLIGDDLDRTIDYQAVSQRLLDFGRGRSWKLIETLAVELAEMILREFKPSRVTVEVKKFVIPQARHVSVRATRPKHERRSTGRRFGKPMQVATRLRTNCGEYRRLACAGVPGRPT